MSYSLAELQSPLPLWSPKAWYYGVARFAIRLGSKLSKGLEIGRKHGFDSGVMLDHVYENRAKGKGPIGRFIDRQYLNAVGWVGIRGRGKLLEKTLVDVINEQSTIKPHVKFADLACGGGRYVLDAIKKTEGVSMEATLRDYEAANIEKTRLNARKLWLTPTIEQADAFDGKELAWLGQRDIVIVSGLHEIIDDDAVVRNHFKQLSRVVSPTGRLVVTIQPDHPQLEFIARALKSHTGKPWAMRLRSADLIADWLTEAGFEVSSLQMEKTGIFGVITAKPITKF